jgi:hypothetical protein
MSDVKSAPELPMALDQAGPKPETIHRVYDLNGVRLAVAATDEGAAAFLDPILAPLRRSIPDGYDWLISMSPVAAIEPPTRGSRIFEGPLPEGLPSVMVRDGNERSFVVPDHFAMRFRRTVRMTEIQFVPGKEGGLGGTAAFWMLDDLLVALGRHLLHGATLVNPATDRSIVLFAPSGTGKTTTALALARSGLSLGGDDALVLDVGEDRASVWAIPRQIKVHRQTAALLPWLDSILSDAWTDDEQAFERGALSEVVALAPPTRRQTELVVALMPPNGNGHTVTRITKPEALAVIACDNLRIAPNGVDTDDTASLSALARLIATTPVIALSVGPEPSLLSRELIGLR